jgi:hypothetical protein
MLRTRQASVGLGRGLVSDPTNCRYLFNTDAPQPSHAHFKVKVSVLQHVLPLSEITGLISTMGGGPLGERSQRGGRFPRVALSRFS